MKQKNNLFTLILTWSFLMSIVVFPSSLSVSPVDTGDLEITSIEKEPGGFIITLTNTGDTYLRGLYLNISVTGGWIMPIDFHYNELLFICNCTDVFEPNDIMKISTSVYDTFISFGFLEVIVDVSSSAIGSRHAEQRAFIIGSFIITL